MKACFQAEAWVSNMSTSATNEKSEVEFEGRPSKLGLGIKITPKMKVAVSSDPVEQKLLGKLNSKKKLSSDDIEKASPVKENAPSDDDENEPESRTSAFVKKRLMPPATYCSLPRGENDFVTLSGLNRVVRCISLGSQINYHYRFFFPSKFES
ncbi:hypothetical protein MUK42_34584 [Musa troglodytarum]|uniref:Uncharacterized protein n=1 Tax=Musa troglodytarum TaxID=320322 RepID=A0A9E7E9I4_9LILI|nr:hypothetical protein MUK42_34584 [Musa troglodytarum]